MISPFIAIESFFNPIYRDEFWPKHIAANKGFLEQIMARQELTQCLNDVLRCLPRPDLSFEAATNQGYATEEQITKLYTSLSNLLESDKDCKRIILYLPFEFLPNKKWRPFEEKLRQASDRFRQVYLETWNRLLLVHDVRANFVDGDVLEEEQQSGNLLRVVKAAHLIPKLVENDLLEVKDVLMLMEESDNLTLKDSIADTLPVLADLGFINGKEVKPRKKRTKSEPKIVTEKRKAWLELREKQKAIEILAKDISTAIREHNFAKESLIKLWESDNPDAKEALLRTLRRSYYLGIVDQKQLAELNIAIPKLAGPFSENLKLMEQEMCDIREMVASIKSNHELSQLIYPTALLFGSRLNGYGGDNADIDIAVFIKPGTSFDNRQKLQKLLEITFAHKKIKSDEIIKFWLEEKENNLFVHDFTEWDVSLGESYWTNILFGAAWIGDKNTICELCEKLLTSYMYETDAMIEGRSPRSLYLEDMEQATLQYRLMHKGYEQFFPPCGGIHALHANEIDGNSMFWDSGYRRLATSLFISNVFLPKIPIIEKK